MALRNVNQEDIAVGKLAICTKNHMYITFDPVILHLGIHSREIIKDDPKIYIQGICATLLKAK